jgi:hypothetical protein
MYRQEKISEYEDDIEELETLGLGNEPLDLKFYWKSLEEMGE